LPNYSNSPYEVAVSSDGKIQVKSGDTLSKYSWAIYKNYTTLSAFKRLGPTGPIPIQDVNLIYAGETLLHMRDYKPGNGGTLPPATSGPSVGPPASGGSGLPGNVSLRFVNLNLPIPFQPKDIGKFRVQFRVLISAQVGLQGNGTLSQDALDNALEGEMLRKIEKTLGADIQTGSYGAIEDAIRKRSVQAFRNAVFEQLRMSISWNAFEWGVYSVHPTIEVQPTTTPLGIPVQRQLLGEWHSLFLGSQR